MLGFNLIMGFFDRLLGKSTRKPAKPAPAQASPSPTQPAPVGSAPDSTPPEPAPPAPPAEPVPEPETPDAPTPDAGPVAPRLQEAFEQLELRNLDGAREIYDEILASTAGERPDVLVRISGDLGSTGHVETIPELIAPLYDAERHGPATGINLLQAYLALRNPGAAQHVLDLLFELKKPELDDRLWGFSNAIGEMMESSKHGPASGKATSVNLVTISKPIWAYGIEDLPGLLPEKSPQAKTVAFAQLTLPDHDDTEALAKKPEEALGRLTRGIPLWLADSLYFSPQYNSAAVIGMVGQDHYMLFPVPWTTDNIRQLIDTTGSKIDYVVTGDLREADGDFQLNLRLWEIKGFRERKTFEVRWTPATADQVLAELQQHLRLFFECQDGPGLPFEPTTQPSAWIDTLAASLSTFLVGKSVLPREQLAALPAVLVDPATTTTAALARLTLAHRCAQADLAHTAPALPENETVERAKKLLSAS